MPFVKKIAIKPEANLTKKPADQNAITRAKLNQNKTKSKARILHESDPFF